MDFGKLLYNAQKNKEVKKEPIKYYSTKFAPPKKEQRDKARLSVNVKKFLEKKEEEEKQKQLEAQKKKEELLALRSKDKKAVKRVNVMLKRTKSANQSVIQDAIDTDNTAVTLVGPAQPDEDDYGYVSQEASAFYSKMMEKYNKMPEEPSKFLLDKKKVNTNLSSTKDRVRAALEKEKEEAMMPHKRKRKHREENYSPDDSSLPTKMVDEKSESKKLKTDKIRPKMPPPMNFNDLLKLAEKKQFEPIVVEKKAKEVENPLTKKQQREMEKMREWQGRKKENKISGSSQNIEKEHKEDSSKPKSEKTANQSKLAAALTKGSSKINVKAPNPELEVRKKIDWGPKHPSAGKINSSLVDTKSSSTKDLEKIPSNNRENSFGKVSKNTTNGSIKNGISNKKFKMENKNSSMNNKIPVDKKALETNRSQEILRKEMSKAKQFPPNDLRPKQFPPSDLRPKQFPPNDLRPKQFPPNDLRPKQFPPNDLRPKQFPSKDIRRPTSNKMQIKKRRILDDDDDEDYDSEMDDFIDDGPEEEANYSKYIQEIFGYNKSKYANMDDDDDLMETSFCQQMREEEFSAHIGELEDIEQDRLEQEHKRKKALMKKKMKK